MDKPAPTRSRRRRARLWVRVAAWCLVGVFALTLVARVARGTWATDMVATLAAQEAWLAALLGVVAIVLRARAAGAAMVVIAGIHFVWLGAVPRAARVDGAPPERTISVLTFNAFAENTRTDLVIRTVLDSGADLVFLLEVTREFSDELGSSPELAARYPHRSLPESGKWWGVAVLSTWPLRELDMRHENRERWKEVFGNYAFVRSAIVDRPEGPFLVTATWPDSPRSARRWAEGNAELRETTSIIREDLAPLGYPMVVGVDLNSTPSGYRTGMLNRLSGLRRAKPWLAARGTWPSSIVPMFRVAIDDVLVSNSIQVTSWTTIERRTGSDHVPVLIRLVLPEGRPAEGVDRR